MSDEKESPLPVYALRPMLYRPVSRLGVNLEDWPLLLGGTFLGYSLVFFFRLRWRGIPLEFFGGLFVFLVLTMFFNWARLGRPRFFLRDEIWFLWSRVIYGPAIHPPLRAWLRLPDDVAK
jgi:hypothetical protein